MGEYVVTAKVGTNADLFPDVAKMYIPEGSKVLDMTWGNGVFWKNMDISKYDLYKNDLDKQRGDYHYDFRDTPWDDRSFDAVIFDPPYLYIGGFKTFRASVDKGYQNSQRALEQGIHGVTAVHQMFYDGMKEAYRLLRPKGTLVVKCMDQVMSGKQEWQHIKVYNYGLDIGFRSEDLFVLVMNGQPLMRHKHQLHARRNHSYFMVFKVPRK